MQLTSLTLTFKQNENVTSQQSKFKVNGSIISKLTLLFKIDGEPSNQVKLLVLLSLAFNNKLANVVVDVDKVPKLPISSGLQSSFEYSTW